MGCQETRGLLHAYLDGELDLVPSIEVEQHVRDCQACSLAFENQQALRAAVRDGAQYYEATPILRKRIRAAVASEGRGEASPRIANWGWRRIGVGLAFILLALWSFISYVKYPSAETLLEQEIISSHVRSLMAEHLTDVPSTDQHTVKPWFSGKLDFSPQVTDLTEQGFMLTGGRLDYVGNRPVAALVYQRRKHVINLYIWPTPPDADVGGRAVMRQGYTLVRWTSMDMTYWAVSDIALADLQEFARAMQNVP